MANLEGKKAPAFSLEGSDGKKHSLADYAGKTLVLYFYPKDDTPGCTKEACGFRDLGASLKKAGAVVLGVSCVFRTKSATHSDANRPPIPEETGHRSGAFRPPLAWGLSQSG